MLSEGAIQIKPNEKRKLVQYVQTLKAKVAELLKNGPLPYTTFLQELNEFSKKGMIAPTLSVTYEWNKENIAGTYDQEFRYIIINLYTMVKISPTGQETFNIVSIDFSALMVTLIHEYVHFKEDMKIRSLHYGKTLPFIEHPPGSAKYLEDPQERQAWAAGHLEYIKHHLDTQDPKKLIAFLRTNGLNINPTLATLKKTDYASWKRIMKNAIMMAIYDLETEKLPRKSPSKDV